MPPNMSFEIVHNLAVRAAQERTEIAAKSYALIAESRELLDRIDRVLAKR